MPTSSPATGSEPEFKYQVCGFPFGMCLTYKQKVTGDLHIIHATVAAPIDASCQVWCCCPLQFTLG